MVAFVVGACNKADLPVEESAQEAFDLPNFRINVQEYAMFLESHIGSDHLRGLSGLKGTAHDPVQIDDEIEEVSMLYLEQEIGPVATVYADNVLTMAASAPILELAELPENLSTSQALAGIRTNASFSMRASNLIYNTSHASEKKLKSNLAVLEAEIAKIASVELEKAYQQGEPTTAAQEDLLLESLNSTLKQKVTTAIDKHVKQTSMTGGLSRSENVSIAVSAGNAIELLKSESLLATLDEAIAADLDIIAVSGGLHEEIVPITKGLFSKIGKFFKKVVKAVAVVAWSAVSVVGLTVLGYLANNYGDNDRVNETSAAVGLAAGVTYVAKNSKKWWRWALR